MVIIHLLVRHQTPTTQTSTCRFCASAHHPTTRSRGSITCNKPCPIRRAHPPHCRPKAYCNVRTHPVRPNALTSSHWPTNPTNPNNLATPTTQKRLVVTSVRLAQLSRFPCQSKTPDQREHSINQVRPRTEKRRNCKSRRSDGFLKRPGFPYSYREW